MKMLKRMRGKTKYFLRKHSPEIEIGLGIVSFGAAVVLAVKASGSEKVHNAKTDLVEELDDIHTTKEKAEKGEIVYPEREAAIDTIKAYSKATAACASAYIPAAAAFGTGTALVLHSHHTMKARYAAMAGAYSALNKAFIAYRDRVAEGYGEDTDKGIRFFAPDQVHVERELDENTGDVKNVMNFVEGEWPGYSGFARLFSSEAYDTAGHINPYWVPDRNDNMTFLLATQSQFQTKLDTEGFVVLADVYKSLGFLPTKASYEVGWVKNNPNKEMIIVDFGITDFQRPGNIDFAAGYNDAIILDFNVDTIWDKAPIANI